MNGKQTAELIARAQHLAFHGDDETTRSLAQEVDRWVLEARRRPFDQGPQKQLFTALANLREHLEKVDASAEQGTD